MKLTVAYCVGGGEKYYKCLEKSIKSLSRLKGFEVEIVIIDTNNKLQSHDNITVFQEKVLKNEINHYQFLRYKLHKYVKSGYTLYLDVDTVLVNDNLKEIINNNKYDFFISRHFWVMSAFDYLNKINPTKKHFDYLYEDKKSVDYKYIASGIFLFNDKAFDILREVEEKFNYLYEVNKDKKIGITDELVLTSVLKKYDNVKLLGGGFNHCAHPPHMPLKVEDGILYGKNPYDINWDPVTHLHADCFSRATQFGTWPPDSYEKEIQSEIKKHFYL